MSKAAKPTVEVRKLDPNNPNYLYHIYPEQNRPQDCYISLDLEHRVLMADWSGEIGNAVPVRVWAGVARRYHIPPLQAKAANDLLDEIAPLAQRVLDDAEVEWDGRNYVARLGDDAWAAEREIEAVIASIDSDEEVQAWSVSDWLGSNSDSEIRLRADMTDEELRARAEELEQEADRENVYLLDDVEDYLRDRREELRAAQEAEEVTLVEDLAVDEASIPVWARGAEVRLIGADRNMARDAYDLYRDGQSIGCMYDLGAGYEYVEGQAIADGAWDSDVPWA